MVHVTRRWRSVVFASPKFLELRLVCGPGTRMELTSIWPPLPIIIRNIIDLHMPEDYDFDSAIAHHNRICEILLRLTSSQLQRLASAMQKEFPELIHLRLDFVRFHSRLTRAPTLPDGFLGGSAPRLQSLELHSITFVALPQLLLSATNLVRLTLSSIPYSGYILPEALVTGLAVLAKLESLTIKFDSPPSLPDGEHQLPLPPTRVILPAITHFQFQGGSEYLEDLVTWIDAPLLSSIWITFFHRFRFDVPQLAHFMRRTTRFQAFNEAHVDFDYSGVQVVSLPQTRVFDQMSVLRILCKEFDRQLSSVEQVFRSFTPSIYMVEHLYIYGSRYLPSQWQDDIENMQWLEIFRPFTAVKNLYVSEKFVQCIALALIDPVAEGVIDVLPALESLLLEERNPSGPVQEAIGQFVAARQLLGHTVSVSHWNGTGDAFLRLFR